MEQDNVNINKPIIDTIYSIVHTDKSDDDFVGFVKDLTGIDTIIDQDVSFKDLVILMELGNEDIATNYSEKEIVKGVVHFLTDVHCSIMSVLISEAKSIDFFSDMIENNSEMQNAFDKITENDDRIVNLEEYSKKPFNQKDGGIFISGENLVKLISNPKAMTMEELYNKTKKTFGEIE